MLLFRLTLRLIFGAKRRKMQAFVGAFSHQYDRVVHEFRFVGVPLVIKILLRVLNAADDVVGKLKNFRKLVLGLGGVSVELLERVCSVHRWTQGGEHEMQRLRVGNELSVGLHQRETIIQTR